MCTQIIEKGHILLVNKSETSYVCFWIGQSIKERDWKTDQSASILSRKKSRFSPCTQFQKDIGLIKTEEPLRTILPKVPLQRDFELIVPYDE